MESIWSNWVLFISSIYLNNKKIILVYNENYKIKKYKLKIIKTRKIKINA